METIGVRELRQNASQYVHRVAAGESITVTERGKPVALMIPVPQHATVYDEMVARGELIPAEHANGVLSGQPFEPLELGFSASEELARQREDRF